MRRDEEGTMGEEYEWEYFTDELRDGLRSVGIENPEAIVVFEYDEARQGEPQRTRSFAADAGQRNPGAGDPSELLGNLTVFGAKLDVNSPRRCYWNGHRWVCF
jgi:hypothetical protein